MIKGTEIRAGMIIRHEGDIFSVEKMEHVTPGKGRAHIQTKLRSLTRGTMYEVRFSPSDKIENLLVENKIAEYLYSDSHHAIFMDLSDYENIELPLENVSEQLRYLRPNAECRIQFIDGEPFNLDLPAAVELEVVDAPPAVKGDTATNVTKVCITETGLEVKTPAHIRQGDKIKVDTRTGEFLERVNL
ncbi:MAG: elongation factor P [Planctomycetota bacterium]